MTNRFFAGQTDYIEQLNAIDVLGSAGAHIADTTGAHAATAISNTPAGNIAATTVQAAINELDTEKLSASATALPSSFASASINSITPTGGLLAVTGSISATGGATISGATSITANVKVGANTAEVSYSSGQPLAAVTNANSRVDIVVRNADSGSSAGAGLVINSYGNSWRMGAGSAARDSNRLRWEIDALGSPVEVMGLGASGGLDVTGNITARLPDTSHSTHRGLKFGVTLYGEDYGGVTMRTDNGEVRYTAGYSGWGGFQTWYCNGVKAMELTSGGSTYNITGTYGSISDAKLKRDVTDATTKLTKVLAMRVVNYFLIADTTNTKMLGMIAQELREISPGLVDETPDYADVIVTPARADRVTKQRQVTATQQVTRHEPRQVNGQWRLMPVTETVQVPQWQELPLFDSAGQPVMETVNGQQVRKMHRVPLMESYTETVNVPAVIESRPTGTTTLSIKYSILVPMLIKALQEMHAEFDSRLKAIGA